MLIEVPSTKTNAEAMRDVEPDLILGRVVE
jgi:hypothetical protein